MHNLDYFFLAPNFFKKFSITENLIKEELLNNLIVIQKKELKFNEFISNLKLFLIENNLNSLEDVLMNINYVIKENTNFFIFLLDYLYDQLIFQLKLNIFSHENDFIKDRELNNIFSSLTLIEFFKEFFLKLLNDIFLNFFTFYLLKNNYYNKTKSIKSNSIIFQENLNIKQKYFSYFYAFKKKNESYNLFFKKSHLLKLFSNKKLTKIKFFKLNLFLMGKKKSFFEFDDTGLPLNFPVFIKDSKINQSFYLYSSKLKKNLTGQKQQQL